MNLLRFQNPKTVSRLVIHRILKPFIWEHFTRPLLTRLSDQDFLSRCGFQGSADDFIASFHPKARLRFFFHPRNQKDFFLNLLTRTQNHEDILAESEDVLHNRFQTLGSAKTSLGGSINWHRDFKSGKVWPLDSGRELDLLDLGNPSDVKVPWELSRFHQVWWLGKAYWLTRNEQYPKKFAELVESWIENNPPGKGVNWSVAMEVAIRAANWIAGYYFFCESPSLTPLFWLRFLKSLHVHGSFIENHLEYSWRTSNHFLSDVVGLIFLGIFFQDAEFGKRWLGWAAPSLHKEMDQEVYPDGVDYEKSTSYQRLVLELFYTTAILCQRNKISLSSAFMQRLQNMFDFVQAYTRPDGSIPLFGDADDGRLFRFRANDEINDHRHALAVGAILFERPDLARAADRFSQDSLWLFGGEGFEIFQRLQGGSNPLSSKAFPDGGFYIMRNERLHVMIDAGDIGMKGLGGHGHNDTLSFELWEDGESIIVDSGTYAYTFDVAARQELRGVRAHNSVMVDKKETAKFVGLWMILKDDTNPLVHEWRTSGALDVLEASHHAYTSLTHPLVHRRRFELDKNILQLKITDFFDGKGKHTIESFLHFAPSITLELIDSTTALAKSPKNLYRIHADAGAFSQTETWYSPSYGVRKKKQTLTLQQTIQTPAKINMVVLRDKA
jgi:uncharacterized heparinase superfamily protein